MPNIHGILHLQWSNGFKIKLAENVQKGVESAKNFYSSRAPQHNRTPKLKIVYQ